MNGPYPKGRLTGGNKDVHNWSGMVVGKVYRVTSTFVDGDRSVVREGTTFKLLGHFFSGFGGVMGIVVSLDGENEWSIPFRHEEEGDIAKIENLSNYIVESQ
jgi:hypothetical protein